MTTTIVDNVVVLALLLYCAIYWKGQKNKKWFYFILFAIAIVVFGIVSETLIS